MYKNNLKKPPESKPLSSSVINLHYDQVNKSLKNYNNPNHSLNAELLKQSLTGLSKEHDLQIQEVNYLNKQKKINKKPKIENSFFQNRQTSQTSSFIFNQNPIKFSKNNQNIYESQQSRNLQKYLKLQNFDYIQKSQIYQEHQKNHPIPHKSKSARNLTNINQNKLKISSEIQKQNNFYPIKKQKESLNQNLQHKVIYQNFRLSDLNFLSDQQFLPQGMYPQNMNKKDSSKNISKKSDSNHPVFRQTLQYVDSARHHSELNINGIDAESRQISDQSSESSIPLTNYDNKSSYRERYRKYKQKYNNSINVIKQFQKLNETLIKDQRQNFQYYENAIKDLQNLLMVKDKEIKQLNHLLVKTKNYQENYSQGLCSIDGRQLQIENQKLKKQIQNKNKKINQLKENKGLNMTQSMIGQQKKQKSTQNMQKKFDFLKKQKQNLSKKITTLEELNKIYESKLKEKQQRLNKLSQLNSELQQQIIKLKSKMHSDETYDTERSFVQDFSKRNKKENLTFSTETFSKYPIVPSQQKFDSPSQIEKYISCIDQQLQLIRSSIMKEKENDNSKTPSTINQLKKKQLSQLDSVSEFQFQDEVQHKLPYKVLQNVVEKLTNFRASMGV